MSISFSVFSPLYNTSHQISQNLVSGYDQSTEGLLRLLAFALNTSISEYSKTVYCKDEKNVDTIEQDSVIEVGKPLNASKNSEALSSEKTKNYSGSSKMCDELKNVVLDCAKSPQSKAQTAENMSTPSPSLINLSVKNQDKISVIEEEVPEKWS